MILEEINLGKTEKEKRKGITDNLGQQVILEDDHNDWCHGFLLKEGYDFETYQMKIIDARGQRQLHYNDLKQLLVINHYSKYKRPEINLV